MFECQIILDENKRQKIKVISQLSSHDAYLVFVFASAFFYLFFVFDVVNALNLPIYSSINIPFQGISSV